MASEQQDPQDELVRRPQLVSVPVAAEYLGVSVSHLYDVIAEKRMTAGVVRIGRTIRIDLDAFIAANEGTA